MRSTIKLLNIAANLATKKNDDRRFLLGAIGIRADGAIVTACNGNPKFPTPEHHCEYRLCRKLDRGATVFLARVLASGAWANSAPCRACRSRLKACQVKVVYYTLGVNEWGTLYP